MKALGVTGKIELKYGKLVLVFGSAMSTFGAPTKCTRASGLLKLWLLRCITRMSRHRQVLSWLMRSAADAVAERSSILDWKRDSILAFFLGNIIPSAM